MRIFSVVAALAILVAVALALVSCESADNAAARKANAEAALVRANAEAAAERAANRQAAAEQAHRHFLETVPVILIGAGVALGFLMAVILLVAMLRGWESSRRQHELMMLNVMQQQHQPTLSAPQYPTIVVHGPMPPQLLEDVRDKQVTIDHRP